MLFRTFFLSDCMLRDFGRRVDVDLDVDVVLVKELFIDIGEGGLGIGGR